MTPVLLRTPNASLWDPRAVHLLLEGMQEATSPADGGPCGTAVTRLTDEVLLCWGHTVVLPGWLVLAQGSPFQQKITDFVRNRPRRGLQTSARPASPLALLQRQEPNPRAVSTTTVGHVHVYHREVKRR